MGQRVIGQNQYGPSHRNGSLRHRGGSRWIYRRSEEDGDFEVEKLSVENLPTEIDGLAITWLNNFAIKKAGNYINQRYKVIVPGLGNGRVVIIDNNSHGKPFFYTGPLENDSILLSDGDPAIGKTG